MTAITKCILCYNEFEEESVPCYSPKLHELCCKYLHSSLTQETLLCQSNHFKLSFCPKCFKSVVELSGLNDELKCYQKRISEFVFILSLEILHRRGDTNNDQNRPNYKNSGRKLIDIDISTLPNCDFKKNSIISEEIETPALECHPFVSEDVYEAFNDPLLIPSTPEANTAEVVFEDIKVDIGNHRNDDEMNSTEDIDTDYYVEKADQSFSTGQPGNKRLIPILKLERLNFQESGRKVILLENDQANLHRPRESGGGMKSQTLWTKNDLGGSFKIIDATKTSAYENCSEDSPQIASTSALYSIPDSSSNLQIYGKNDSGVTETPVTDSTNYLEKQNFHLNQSISKIFHCHIRDKTLPPEQKLEIQAAVHSEESQYNCDVCGEIFKTKGYLLKHKMIHTRQRHYKFAIDKKRFKSKLMSHKFVHGEERPFKCDVCGTGFRRLPNLIRHSRTHTGDRPYNCEVCSKVFTRKEHLARHSKIHTGGKPYNCEVWDKEFTQQGGPVKHSKNHSVEKPFKCDECDYASNQRGNLKLHKIYKHSSLKNFKCRDCQEDFKTKNLVKMHYKRVHFALQFSDDCILKNI